MEIATEYKVDRANWPSGPWDTEPDKLQWIDLATDLDCLIVRNRLGALCGYVGVAAGHPWYGSDYDDVSADAHGGLTYAEKCRDPICHVPQPGRSDDIWWLGFDCCHFGDLCPGDLFIPTISIPDGIKYRDMAYVRRECESLAQQAKRAAI